MLPQEMMNSPMLCVASTLEGARSVYPQAYILYDMDDILLAAQE